MYKKLITKGLKLLYAIELNIKPIQKNKIKNMLNNLILCFKLSCNHTLIIALPDITIWLF